MNLMDFWCRGRSNAYALQGRQAEKTKIQQIQGIRASAILCPDYRHTYSPQTRAEIKRFFRSEWFRALTRLDGETLITRLENERNVKAE